MRRYRVELSGNRPVTAKTIVYALDEKDAAAQALEKSGDLDWDCDVGTVDLEVESVALDQLEPTPPAPWRDFKVGTWVVILDRLVVGLFLGEASGRGDVLVLPAGSRSAVVCAGSRLEKIGPPALISSPHKAECLQEELRFLCSKLLHDIRDEQRRPHIPVPEPSLIERVRSALSQALVNAGIQE